MRLRNTAFLALLPHAMLSPGVRDIHDVSFAVLLGLLGGVLQVHRADERRVAMPAPRTPRR